MIEMLGVLAIIGVLSAGGIWGYNVAVENARVNQLISDIGDMTVNARGFFARWKSTAKREMIYMAQLQQIGIVPAKYKVVQGWTSLFMSFSGTAKTALGAPMSASVIAPAVTNYAGWGRIFLRVGVMNLSKSACVKLLTHNWKELSVRQLQRNNLRQTFAVMYCGDATYCNDNVALFPPLTPAKAEEVCAIEDATLGRYMVFHINLV